MDIAIRSQYNPLLRPADLKAGINGMEITCLLNPGVFRMINKTWLLLRVAERPKQIADKISFPIYNNGKIEVLSFEKNDPQLDATDGLAAAYCHFLQLGRPTSEKAYSGWKDFISKNEDKVKKPKLPKTM